MTQHIEELAKRGKGDEVTEHYEKLLGNVYDWMAGDDFQDSVNAQYQTLKQVLPKIESTNLAIDLGCGSGFQTFALAQLGFSKVIALDTSAVLLEALTRNISHQNVSVHQADMLDVGRFVEPQSADLIVCMGDTLTHLSSDEAVNALIKASADALKVGGQVVLTFRDYSTALIGAQRFIPVRSDENRIMMCFLEYEETHVKVHDILYERNGVVWNHAVNAYPKLRVSPGSVQMMLQDHGFRVFENKPMGRMHTIGAVRN